MNHRRLLEHFKSFRAAYVILLCALLLTLSSFSVLSQAIKKREQESFANASNLVVEQMESQLEGYVTLMKGVRALITGNSEVNPKELTRYFQALKALDFKKDSGLEGIGVVWKVPASQREAHVALMKRMYRGYKLSPEGRNRMSYPIVHIEGVGPDPKRALGWDCALDALRERAIEQADASGEATASERAALFHADGSPGPTGFLIYLPIFRAAPAPDGNRANGAVVGFVFAALNVTPMWNKLLLTSSRSVDVEVYDGEPEASRLMFDDDQIAFDSLERKPVFTRNLEKSILGRKWTLRFYSRPAAEGSVTRRLPVFFLAAGTAASFALFGVVIFQAKGREAALRHSRELEKSEAVIRSSNKDLGKALAAQLATLESTADGILVTDNEGRIVNFNRRFLEMWGMEGAATKAKDTGELASLLKPRLKDPEEFSAAAEEVGRLPRAEHFHLLPLQDGRLIERYTRPQLDNGVVIGQVYSFREVTHQKLAEERLAAEKERLAVTLRAIGDAVVSTDVEGRIQVMNRVAEEMSGLRQEKCIGRQIGAIFKFASNDSSPPLEAELRALAGNRNVEQGKQSVFHSRNKGEILVERRSSAIHDGSGAVSGAVFVFRDVTQSRKLEEEMLRASKLESIGVLAGGIAHDFNNVLTGIVGNLSLAREDGALPPDVETRLGEVERAAYKARGLTQQLLTFARGGMPVRQTVALEELIREAAGFALAGSNVRPEFEFDKDLAAVDVDASQITQVIQNLTLNAAQAMPDGGVVRVCAENMVITQDSNLPLAPGKYVKVAVIDHGPGISPDHLPKIFDPYFTTKPKGSGLGLATVYSIIKRHEGLVTVEASPGKGSRFHFYLQASESRPPARIPEGMTADGVMKSRILVLDDEPSIRALLEAVLGHFGHKVVTVAEGGDAIQAYEKAMREKNPFHAVILDLTIPGGMGGKDTVVKLREIDPGVKAIVSS